MDDSSGPRSDHATRLGLPGRSYGRVTLPDDDRMHPDASTEWWYFTGHLADEQGRRYGFELTAFKVWDFPYRVGPVHLSRSYEVDAAISELTEGRFHSKVHVLLPAPLHHLDDEVLDVHLGATRIAAVGPFAYHLSTHWHRFGIDLTATAMREPVAQGDGGWVEMGGAGGSFYTSVTRLETAGTLTIDGEERAVTGVSWMDHQWGSWDWSAVSTWDWFSLRMADGTDVMAFAFPDGARVATACHADGTTETIPFSYEPVGTWTSPRSGTTYPSGWRLDLPGMDASLLVTPELVDQEVVNERDQAGTYWEGSCSVSGTSGGVAVEGLAYVELAGYARPLNQSEGVDARGTGST